MSYLEIIDEMNKAVIENEAAQEELTRRDEAQAIAQDMAAFKERAIEIYENVVGIAKTFIEETKEDTAKAKEKLSSNTTEENIKKSQEDEQEGLELLKGAQQIAENLAGKGVITQDYKNTLDSQLAVINSRKENQDHESVGDKHSSPWFKNANDILQYFHKLVKTRSCSVMPTGEYKYANGWEAAKAVIEDYNQHGKAYITEEYMHKAFASINNRVNQRRLETHNRNAESVVDEPNLEESTIEAKAEVVTPAKLVVSKPEIKSNKGVYAVAANH